VRDAEKRKRDKVMMIVISMIQWHHVCNVARAGSLVQIWEQNDNLYKLNILKVYRYKIRAAIISGLIQFYEFVPPIGGLADPIF